MSSPSKLDFILNCYADKTSDINKDGVLDIIFFSVKKRESINGGILGGGSEKLNVVCIDSSEYEGTITPSEFFLSKSIPFSKGGGYNIIIKGDLQNPKGKFYVGSYKVYDSSTNKEIPFLRREFRMNAGYFLKKNVA